MPERTVRWVSEGHSAAAPRTATAAACVQSAASRGWALASGSHTAIWTTTWGSNSRTIDTILRRSFGSTRWNVARRSRRRGGSMSRPVISPTHRSFSSSVATSEPSSLPMPLTRTRLPPLTEVTVAVGSRRSRANGLELCHPDRPGGRDRDRGHRTAPAARRALPVHRPLDAHRQRVGPVTRGHVGRVPVGVGAGGGLVGLGSAEVVGDAGAIADDRPRRRSPDPR